MRNFLRVGCVGSVAALSACAQWGLQTDDVLGGGAPYSSPVSPPAPPLQPPTLAGCAGQFVSIDETYRHMQADLLRQDAEDRPFTRYVLLTDRFNEGLCSNELDADRAGLFKMLQMVSLSLRLSTPVAVDADEVVYRVDIRDYDWDRELTVAGESFEDGWEAMTAFNPYALPFVGDEAELLQSQAETAIPWVSSNSLVNTVSQGPLYYALIDVDVEQSLADFLLDDLGIDRLDNLEQGNMVRAGERRDAASNEATIVERHDVEVRQGYLWLEQRGNFASDPGTSNGIVDDPLQFPDGGRSVVFTLPNQIQAFIVADTNDTVVVEGEPRFELGASAPVAPTPLSLASQHFSGFPVVVDEVRERVEAQRFNFNGDDFETVQDIYVRPEAFAAIQEADFADARRALERIGVAEGTQEPVNSVVNTFQEDLNLERLAAELGVSRGLLVANIQRLDPSLDNAVTVPTPRATVERIYRDSLCILQTASQNRPLDCL